MRPTWPLLALTLLQGLSAGLMGVAACVLLVPGFHVPAAEVFIWEGVALVAGALGGVASFFHMHRLQAARYVMRRLRSSWLSREALSTAVYMMVVAVTVIVHLLWPAAALGWTVASVTAAVLGVAAMFITAMLYATIPAMRSWHSPITVLVFLSAGILSGTVTSYALFMGDGATAAVALHDMLMVVIVVFGSLKVLQIRHFREAAGNVLSATGTGMAGRPYRLQDTGSDRRPYRTQTQIWPELPPRLRSGLYSAVFALSVGIPLLLLAVASGFGVSVLVLASVLGGIFVERWMFFADATHSSRVWFADQPKLPSPVRRDPKRAYSKSPSM